MSWTITVNEVHELVGEPPLFRATNLYDDYVVECEGDDHMLVTTLPPGRYVIVPVDDLPEYLAADEEG